MDSILAWNVRGLNTVAKQNEVRFFLNSRNVKLLSLLETRVKNPKLGNMYLNLCHGWCFSHNNSCHENGRIVIGWCPSSFTVDIVSMTSQFIHCCITPRHNEEFLCTFVYGFNGLMSRRELWSGLKKTLQMEG